MKQRGRPSAASQEIITRVDPSALDRVERQRAPHDLTDEEVEVWSAIVNAESADWFTPSSVPLLAQYCRHVVQARKLSEWIDRAPSDKSIDVEGYDRLLKMQARETAAICTLATKMRISPHSQTNHRGNKKPGASRKPWEG